MGWHLLRTEKKTAEAITVFKTNVEWFPDSSNTWVSLARAYLSDKQYQLALTNIEKAIVMTSDDDRMMGFYQRIKQRIERAMANAEK